MGKKFEAGFGPETFTTHSVIIRMASIGFIMPAQHTGICHMCCADIKHGQLITKDVSIDGWVHAECVNTLHSMIRQMEYEFSINADSSANNGWQQKECDVCYTTTISTRDGMCMDCHDELTEMSMRMEKNHYSTVGMVSAE